MTMHETEADTRANRIDPVLNEAGWGRVEGSQVQRELICPGRILAGGVRDMADWVNKLYGQAFAAVYVQPGAKVAVHLEKPLAIDFDPEGRKVDHRAGESHALELE